MLKRLSSLGLVTHRLYYGASLTPPGRRIAVELVRHHRLLELYLHEALGYALSEVHDEAERLEHHISDDFASRIDILLGGPTHDPHGDPIPTVDGVLPAASRTALRDLAVGDRAVVVRVPDRDPAFLRYLGELGVIPLAELEVCEIGPFDGPITIRLSCGSHRSLGAGAADQVIVERRVLAA